MGYSDYECVHCYEYTRYNVPVSDNLKRKTPICLECVISKYQYMATFSGFYTPIKSNKLCHSCGKKDGEKIFVSLCEEHQIMKQKIFVSLCEEHQIKNTQYDICYCLKCMFNKYYDYYYKNNENNIDTMVVKSNFDNTKCHTCNKIEEKMVYVNFNSVKNKPKLFTYRISKSIDFFD
jgi:hypothetical protein